MGHKNTPFQDGSDFFRNILKKGGVCYHIVGNAGERLDIGRNGLLGVDQGFEVIYNSFTVMHIYRDFSNAVGCGIPPGSFNVNDSELQWPDFLEN